MTVSRFNVERSKNLAISLPYFYIKKRDIPFTGLIGKLNTRIIFIKNFQNIVKFFFTMHPQRKYHQCIWTILGIVIVAFQEVLSQTCLWKDMHIVVQIWYW